MYSNPLDIEIRLTLCCNDDFPAEYVTTAIQCISEAYFASEIADLKQIRKKFPELPSVAFDAAEHRIKEFKKSSVNIRSAHKGSIEFAIFATGLCVWVLQQTVGETIKEAWKESNMNKKLKEFLTKNRFRKIEKIRESSRKRLIRKLPCEVGGPDDISLLSKENQGAVIQLKATLHPDKKFPPRRGDLFNNNINVDL